MTTGLITSVSAIVATKNVRSVLRRSSAVKRRTVLTQTAKASEIEINKRTNLDIAEELAVC